MVVFLYFSYMNNNNIDVCKDDISKLSVTQYCVWSYIVVTGVVKNLCCAIDILSFPPKQHEIVNLLTSVQGKADESGTLANLLSCRSNT